MGKKAYWYEFYRDQYQPKGIKITMLVPLDPEKYSATKMCKYPKLSPQKIQNLVKIGIKSAANTKPLVSRRFGYQVIQSVSGHLDDF